MASTHQDPETSPAVGGSVPAAPRSLTEVLAEIAHLANRLCGDLADDQWDTADSIRHLAETATTPPGASS
ncbi:hypothetical protein ABZ705_24115 [Streptomyces sp. NPDC006984]|uniref:hypothetical protein n=1 Tax=Streptomyces sp. NPDC006984 TaxID=3155463 RepID=UPI0033E99530